MAGRGASRQAYNDVEDQITVETVGDLEQRWVATTDGGDVGDPVTSVRGVHVSDATAVYGFRAGTGDRLWAHDPGSTSSPQQPYVRGEEVWAGSLDPATPPGVGPTVVLDAATGDPLEEASADRVLVGTRGHHVAFWTRRNGSAVQMDVLDVETSSWICCDGLLFSGDASTPRPVTLGPELFYDAGFGLTSTDVDDIGNGVRGYRISPPLPCWWIPIGMCPLWVTPLDGTTSTAPVLSDDRAMVFVGTDAGTLYAVDAATGSIAWSAPVGSEVTDPPALAAGTLFVPTVANGVVALAAAGCGSATCSPVWAGEVNSPVDQQPAVAGGVVFAGTADGEVLAFDAAGCGTATCEPVWSAATASEITGAPAVSNGQLYVGTADGRLIAYALDN